MNIINTECMTKSTLYYLLFLLNKFMQNVKAVSQFNNKAKHLFHQKSINVYLKDNNRPSLNKFLTIRKQIENIRQMCYYDYHLHSVFTDGKKKVYKQL